MPKSDFVFGSFDTSTSAAYYKLQPINFPTPEKDVETFEVPGRSGDLLIDYGSYKNVELTVEIAIDGAAVDSDFITLYDALRAAIMVQNGYQRLEDSLYPNEYRVARAVKCERDQSDTQIGKAVFTFDAKPQRYLTSGEEVAATLNPTNTPLTSVIGMPDSILNADTLSLWEALRAWTGIYGPVLCVDVSQFDRRDGYVAKIKYPNNYNSEYATFIRATGPFSADTYVGAATGQRYVKDFIISVKLDTINYDWLIVDKPQNVWIEDANGVNVASILPNSATITPPALFPYSPLLKLSWLYSGEAISDVLVAAVGGVSIGINVPNIYTLSGTNIVTMYIDCETYNAYMYDGNTGAVINLNKYVTIEGDMDFSGPTTLSMNQTLYKLEIIPRWWKI